MVLTTHAIIPIDPLIASPSNLTVIALGHRVDLKSDLADALRNNQFRLYYQPIVELRTGSCKKAEALIRWQHPERGLVGPNEFIPLAEENELIVKIGDWVFKEAVRQVTLWRASLNAEFQISINMSPLQVGNNRTQGTGSWVAHLNELKLSGKAIVIEITEGVMLDPKDPNVINTLGAFQKTDIQVALDDFGTGRPALDHLRNFSFNYLKIDRSFIEKVATSPFDTALCKEIILMAHRLGISVIAEGVETEAQRHLLAEAGCDYGQGYLFSKPVPPEEFEEKFEGWCKQWAVKPATS